ncbi:hypothetical protein J7E83_05735 [Arthrobacter sp. ISL-48]|uniref:hypothetical protein n=1 Tax=Arthrobacter sp. ISL-48 TaxID=2819110 RepID=UPI001BEC2AC6|nr:hypothetical protein [Arthrobacter sp. ISL-48]MBT2531629.1 hypothetical protein [Arthrobacter sp. ISL-48]
MTESQPQHRKLRSAAELREQARATRAESSKTGAKTGNANARGDHHRTIQAVRPPASSWVTRATADVAALRKDPSPLGRRYAAAISAPRPGQRLPYIDKPYIYSDADGVTRYVATLSQAKRGVDLAHLQSGR